MNIENLAHLHFPEMINTEDKKIKPEIATEPPVSGRITVKETPNASKWNLVWKLGQFNICDLESTSEKQFS